MLESACVGEHLLASQQRFSSMKLVSQKIPDIIVKLVIFLPIIWKDPG
jgi:hypothetical protein